MKAVGEAEYTVTQSRDLRLSDAVTAAAGAMLAGRVFLFPGLLADATGPGLLAALLLGAIVALPTALVYAELGAARPEASGSHLWVREGLNRLAGFQSAWIGWMAHAAAGGFLAAGFGGWLAILLSEWLGITLFGLDRPSLGRLLAGLLVLLLALRNLRGSLQRGRLDDAATLAVLVAVGLFALSGLGAAVRRPDWAQAFFPLLPNGLGRLLAAAGLATLAFAGCETIALSNEEIKEPAHNIPRAALYSLVGASLVSLISGFVWLGAYGATGGPAWRALAAAKESAPLMAAEQIIPGGAVVLPAAGLVATVFGLNAMLYSASRLAFALGRDRNLPPFLSAVHPVRRTPHWAIGISGLLIALLAALLPLELAAATAGLLFCLNFALVNMAALALRRGRPERGPGFAAPWFPYLPTLTVVSLFVLIVALFGYLPGAGFLASGWLIAGFGIYAAYTRRNAATERMPVLHAEVAFEKDFRVVVPVVSPKRVPLLTSLASALAASRDGEVLALHVEPVPAPLPIGNGQQFADGGRPLLAEAVAALREKGALAHSMLRLAHHPADAIRETVRESNGNLLILGWGGQPTREGRLLGSTLDPLLADPPCDLALVRVRASGDPRRVLVPMAGGPNARLAADLALRLAEQYDGEVTALYVALAGSTQADKAARQGMLRELLGPLAAAPRLNIKILAASSPAAGIAAEARTGYDLVMLGASEDGLLDRLLFGDAPMRLAQQLTTPVVVVKQRAGVVRLGLRRAWRWLTARFPSLEAADRLQVYRDMRRGARPSIDYFVLIGLAATLASFGLLLNSGAVIIGAMLVAPLMSPILASGLGLVQGDLRMLRVAGEAALKGILLAIALGAIFGFIAPEAEATPEIMARTQPSLLDLGVALASGAAGAYAISRKEVSAALPGVAIAAALVPPLATVGLGVSLARPDISIGALLLFITNLIAISAAGAAVFLLFGFQPAPGDAARALVLRRGVVGEIVLLTLVALILGVLTLRLVGNARFDREVRAAVAAEVGQMTAVTLEDVKLTRQTETVHLDVTVRTTRSIAHAEVVDLQTRIAARLERPLALTLTIIPTTKLDPLVPPTRTPTPTNPPTATPGPSATPTATATPTASATPTNTPTPTPTNTPTPTPTPTPVAAIVANTDGLGLVIREQPEGRILGTLPEGAPVQILYRREEVDGVLWLEIRDALSREGWVVAEFVRIQP